MSTSAAKKRNAGACDLCKKRKIRCDSGVAPGNRCSNCINAGQDCTHTEVMKTLGSAKGYVETGARGRSISGFHGRPTSKRRGPLAQRDQEINVESRRASILWQIERDSTSRNCIGLQISTLPIAKRTEFWDPMKWLHPDPDDAERPEYSFPDADLLPALVELYFVHENPYYPVLHRPTFERRLKEELHLRDHRYAATLLLVCSLGARHCNDPRVCLDGVDNFHSAGWKWHNQVRVIPKQLFYKPSCYELQAIALSSLFLLAVSPAAWNQIGFGLRRAQDVGAHRRMKQPHPTAETEQWKRVFWVLLCLDWLAGTATGRPLAMHEPDYDQDFPVECDDEYWDLPEPLNFRQPNNKPSEISYFVFYAKLLEIQASVTTTIYSPRQPKDIASRTSSHVSDAHNIIAFDSALNSWLMDIPEHLRWDPERKNPLHFNQSALLYAGYYHVQILVHRPYIPAPLEVSRPGAMPSLTICTNAARACARIFNAQEKRGIEPTHSIIGVAFTAAIILLLHTWSGKRSGFAYNPAKELEDIYTCMRLLSAAENRFQSAGRFNDILVRLISVGDMSDQPFSKPYTEKTEPPQAQKSYKSSQPGLEPSAFVNRPFEHSPAGVKQLIGDMDFTSTRNATQARQPIVAPAVTPNVFANPAHPGFLAAFNPTGATDIEQLLSMEPTMHHNMVVDSDPDLLSMWSAAPSGFQLADWESYLMSTGIPPELGNFSSPSSSSSGQFPPTPPVYSHPS
uniref:Zn(2)-C6 fungal-type domain-containing protein n=1 Tax=Mycena chlorophos TaxID=658473 RepID=A0ABQ0LQB2_MYCCL|nr:predicted protein [Mycena chlorophos]